MGCEHIYDWMLARFEEARNNVARLFPWDRGTEPQKRAMLRIQDASHKREEEYRRDRDAILKRCRDRAKLADLQSLPNPECAAWVDIYTDVEMEYADAALARGDNDLALMYSSDLERLTMPGVLETQFIICDRLQKGLSVVPKGFGKVGPG